MLETHWTVQEADTADLPATDVQEIRLLLDVAFGGRFSSEDWNHALGGRHFFIRNSAGRIVSHASVVERKLETSGYPLSTGYVEAVATQPEFQRQGLATAVMHAVGEFVQDRFELSALSSSRAGFYEKRGWIRWRGATWCREEENLARTADEDGGVFVKFTRHGPLLDVEGDIVVQWRAGDVW